MKPKQDLHKIGEHGAVGILTPKGLICTECGKPIKQMTQFEDELNRILDDCGYYVVGPDPVTEIKKLVDDFVYDIYLDTEDDRIRFYDVFREKLGRTT